VCILLVHFAQEYSDIMAK